MTLALVTFGLLASVVAVSGVWIVQWSMGGMPLLARIPLDGGIGAALLAASFVFRSLALFVPACALLASYASVVLVQRLTRRTREVTGQVLGILASGNRETWIRVATVFRELKAHRGGIRGAFVGKALEDLSRSGAIELDRPVTWRTFMEARVRLRVYAVHDSYGVCIGECPQ